MRGRPTKYLTNVLENLKTAIYNYYNLSTGEVREVGLNEVPLSKERGALLGDLIDLCLNTNYLSLEARVYLRHGLVRLPMLSEVLLKEEGVRSSYNDCRSKARYACTKLREDFGEKAVALILDQREPDLSELADKVCKVREKYCKISGLSDYLLDFDTITANPVAKGNGEVTRVVELMGAYRKATVAKFISMNEETLGFIKYLMSSAYYRERYRDIVRLIGGSEP